MAVAYRSLGVLLTVVALAGCTPRTTDSATASPSTDACAPDRLTTITPGRLTIGTDTPYPPWFVDNRPDNGKGFEGAVAYAVADELGFSPEKVTWAQVTADSAVQAGPKTVDFDINQVTITDERRQAVDFSSPYYDVRQALVARRTSTLVGARSVADLTGAKLGAQAGTPGHTALTDLVRPTTPPLTYESADTATAALRDGRLDGLVLDLPAAYLLAGPEIADAVVVGQLPRPAGTPARFGLVLAKGSALTACVSRAVDALRSANRLALLEQRWLTQETGVPELS